MQGRRKTARTQREPAERHNIRIAMVGFFDLLGFSARVEAVRSERALAKIAASVKSIRRHFDYRPQDSGRKHLHKIIEKRVLAFSDCIVTSMSLESKHVGSMGAFDAIGSELSTIAYSQTEAALAGNFLRGGLDMGYWYFESGIFVGPPMISAYKLERDEACHPVIAVSDRLYRFLRDHPHRHFYHESIDPMARLFRSFKHPKSEKRIRFINYLGLMAADLDWQYDRNTYEAYMTASADSDERGRIMDEGYAKNLVRFFGQHRKVVSAAYEAASTQDVRKKYRFLAQY
jgi:hypothetical protein